MKLPEKYSHLNDDQKKIFIEKVIDLYWDEDLKQLKNSDDFWKEIIDFLFSYIFSDSEQRSKIRDELNNKYYEYVKQIQLFIQKMNKLNIETNEFKSYLEEKNDIESLENQILSL